MRGIDGGGKVKGRPSVKAEVCSPSRSTDDWQQGQRGLTASKKESEGREQ